MKRLVDGDYFADRDPLLPGEVNPYVTAVIHPYWDFIDELYRTFQKIDHESDRAPNGVYSIWHDTIYPLGLISCAYVVQSKGFTMYVMRDEFGHMPGFILWNGILDRRSFKGWPYEDMLYDLLRIYGAVSTTANMCSTA